MKSVVILREFANDELCRDVLYREIIASPEGLIKKL